MIDRADVEAAQARLGDRLRLTPVLDGTVTTPDGTVPVTFKLEQLQFGGSFKTRGSLNALLHSAAGGSGPAEVVIASGGNAGIAAATASAMQAVRCVVVVPVTAPQAKVDTLHRLGAEVFLQRSTYAESFQYATELALQRRALQLHAYDLPDVVAGAGVIGLELDDQAPEATSILVAVGGGGLISGIATAVGSSRRVIGVEPEGVPTLNAAIAHGAPIEVAVNSIAADALGASKLGDIAMSVVQREDVQSVLVSDEAIVAARAYLWTEFRIIVELAGATALAAIMSGRYIPAVGERPVIVLCGANTDPATI